MTDTDEFQTFFAENYTDNDLFGMLHIRQEGKKGKSAPKKRAESRCASGRRLKAASLTGADRYMTYNTLKYIQDGENGGKTLNRDKTHVRRLMFCYADLDTYRIAPEGCDMERFNEGLVQELEENVFGIRIPCPSHIIFSGRGMYFLWKVDEHAYAYPRWAEVQKFLHGALREYGSDGAVTTDSARVFRVPGSTNTRSGKKVRMLRSYGKSYTLYEIMSEYMQPDGRAAQLPARKHYYVFHWGHRLYADRMGDLRRLLLKYRDREDAFRENILFLYRYYHLCMYKDKDAALKAVKSLNAALKHPLPEGEAVNATKSAEKYFDDGCSFGISNKKLLRFLNVKEHETDALKSIKSEKLMKEEKREKNRKAYVRRLKQEGKKEKRTGIYMRRMAVRKLLSGGKKEQEICHILHISRATFYKDRHAVKIMDAALKKPRKTEGAECPDNMPEKHAPDGKPRNRTGHKQGQAAKPACISLPRNRGSGAAPENTVKGGGENMQMSELEGQKLHDFKKKLGLPVRKGPVYMKKRSYMDYQPVRVTDVAVVKEYPDSFTLEILTEEGENIRIHSAYFAEMQQAGFAGKMQEQAGKV